MLLSSVDNKYYMCKNNSWNMVTDTVQINTDGMTCNAENDGSVVQGLQKKWYYVCDGSEWRSASTDEYEQCTVDGNCSTCVESIQGKFITRNSVEYVCDKKSWRATNVAEHAEQSLCTADSAGKILYDIETSGSQTIDWLCKDNQWQRASLYDYSLEQWKKHLANHTPEGITFGKLTDTRDGRTYKTVKIGDQTWMAENLNYADSVTNPHMQGNSWCYNNEQKNCEIGGRYYTWTATMDIPSQYQSASVSGLNLTNPHQGICPEGWHIPTSSEWSTLNSNADYAAQQMTGFASWTSATNSSGFSALPVGYYSLGNFGNVGSGAVFWSASEGNASYAYYWGVKAGGAGLNYGNEDIGFAVRCLQDPE